MPTFDTRVSKKLLAYAADPQLSTSASSSRSIVDFAKTLEVFDKHNVTLVSVTQAFDTSAATGKLMMRILMSFAEFERQMISERTRDKIAAARRKGKWSGGMPLLGYDVVDTKLVVNEDEADRVRQIFELYLEHRSLLATVKELNRRAWVTKTRRPLKKGIERRRREKNAPGRQRGAKEAELRRADWARPASV